MNIADDSPGLSPKPTEKKKKNTTLIALVIAGVLFCLCCLLVLVAGYVFRQQIPFVSDLFATATPTFTPTPEGIRYDNTGMGIHLYYPREWYLEYVPDLGNAIAFVSSPDLIDSGDYPSDAVAFIIIRDRDFWLEASSEGGDTSSPLGIIDMMYEFFVYDEDAVLEYPAVRDVAGYPGAQAIYELDIYEDYPFIYGLLVSMSGDFPTLIIYLVAEPAWPEAQPLIEELLDTLRIDAVMP